MLATLRAFFPRTTNVIVNLTVVKKLLLTVVFVSISHHLGHMFVSQSWTSSLPTSYCVKFYIQIPFKYLKYFPPAELLFEHAVKSKTKYMT